MPKENHENHLTPLSSEMPVSRISTAIEIDFASEHNGLGWTPKGRVLCFEKTDKRPKFVSGFVLKAHARV